MKIVAIVCGLLLCCAQPVYCSEARVDTSGKGAVLCAHQVTARIYEFGLLCHPEEGEKVAAFRRALSLYEDFISRNGRISLEAARRHTDIARGQVLAPGVSTETATCSSVKRERDWLDHAWDVLTIALLERVTHDTLSVDREPLMQPCWSKGRRATIVVP
jgi:hypothetical protein